MDECIKDEIELPSGKYSREALETLTEICHGSAKLKIPKEDPDCIKELKEKGLIRGFTRFIGCNFYGVENEASAERILEEYIAYDV